MGTQPPPLPRKGHNRPPLGPCLLWPNGWMDQHATWYGGRPQSIPHCVRLGPSLPHEKGHSSRPVLRFVDVRRVCINRGVCCGQMATLVRIALDTEVGLGQGDTVLHGDTAPSPTKRGTAAAQLFGACLSCCAGGVFCACIHKPRHVSCGETVAHLSYC